MSIALMSALLASFSSRPPAICMAMESGASIYDAEKYDAVCDAYLEERIKKAAETVTAAELKGQVTACAMQRYIQSKWHKRFGRFGKAVEQCDLLEREIGDQEIQRRALVQDERGSYGACSDEWVLKLDASMEYIWRARGLGRPLPVYPSFLDDVNSPELLWRAFAPYLDPEGKLPTRARRSGLNNLTGLIALLYRGMPKEYRFHPDLKAALEKILDDKWQDPETGFWGVPVKREGRVESLSDISITFHIIGYREGRVKRWPRIIETILAMKEGDWPQGWKEEGRFSHHHLYDVVRFFRLGWPHMNANQRKRAGRELDAMLVESVRRLLDPNYDFNDPNADEAIEAIDYHVFFHDEIGSFKSGRAFWRPGPVLEPATRGKIIARLQARLSRFNAEGSQELQRAQRILSSAAKGPSK